MRVELSAGIEIACVDEQFAFAIALKSIARQDIEDSVGAVADIGR